MITKTFKTSVFNTSKDSDIFEVTTWQVFTHILLEENSLKFKLNTKNKFYKKNAITLALTLPLLATFPTQSFAQENDADLEKIIVTGTRLSDRSAADSPVPVDIISGEDFRQNSSTDVQDMLRTAVPSFDVNTQPISDAASIVRPANLRGLSPDNVLVLVNGKRDRKSVV